jgi:hypothetical protein
MTTSLPNADQLHYIFLKLTVDLRPAPTPIFIFRVEVPSFLAGAVTTLAFLVAFSDSIKLFFFMTIAPQSWIRVKQAREAVVQRTASPDSESKDLSFG